jgi:tetratricopeptide (TPR) repeat protein
MTTLLSLVLIASSPLFTHSVAVERLQAGRYTDAARLCRDALPRIESSYGADSLETGLILRDLARADRLSGYLRRAEALQRRLVSLVRARLGEEDANVALALDGLGEILFEQRRFTEARRTFQAALRIGAKGLDPRSPHVQRIALDLEACSRSANVKASAYRKR